MLYRFGFGIVWLSQGVGNVELFLCMFKQRVSDISRQEWSSNITSLSKLDTYCTFKSLLEPERYLYCTNIYVHRKALAKLRCSNHNLAIEKLRGTIDRGNRHCKYCLNLNNTYVVENEYNFIMFCPLYESIRQRFISRYCTNRSYTSFRHLMSSQSEILLQNLCNFTFYAFKLHSTFMGF